MTPKNLNSKKKYDYGTRWKAKFEKPLVEYQGVYAVDVRTIKSWIATGKKAQSLPPLDQPWKMLAWWQATPHSRPPPQIYYDLSKTDPSLTPPLDLSDIKGLTPEQNVQRLREMLEITERRLRHAVEHQDESAAALHRRDYNAMFEIWRKAEESLAAIEKARGHSLDRATVEAEIAQSLEMLRLSRERMGRDILIDLETTCPKRLTRIWSKLRPLLERSIQKVRSAEEQIFRNVGHAV